MNARILPDFDILCFGGRLQSLNELLQVWAFNLSLSAVQRDFDVLLAVRALGIHFCNFFANYYFYQIWQTPQNYFIAHFDQPCDLWNSSLLFVLGLMSFLYLSISGHS